MTDLVVITPYFNVHRRSTIFRNWRAFACHIAKLGGRLLTIELAFGDRPFQTYGPNTIHIRTNHVLWHKEALLNYALKFIPSGYTKVAWMDADILCFDERNWLKLASEALDNFEVVQMFQTWQRFLYCGSHDKQPSFMYALQSEPGKISLNSWESPGGGWCARRETITRCGFYDYGIVGSADGLMACAFAGLKPYALHRIPEAFRGKYSEWAAKIPDSGFRCSYLDVNVLHLYHGSIRDRQYRERDTIIAKCTPDALRRGQYGLLEWANPNSTVQHEVLEFFGRRNEDGDTSRGVYIPADSSTYPKLAALLDGFGPLTSAQICLVDVGLSPEDIIDAAVRNLFIIEASDPLNPLEAAKSARLFDRAMFATHFDAGHLSLMRIR